MSATIHIFAGPSLPPAARPPLSDVVFHAPVAQGDVYAVVRHRPFAIGIIDGYFERVPAVWHKEILWALSEGIHVYGAASMGALRAAELASFGMVGVGQIYDEFATGRLTDDDEVTIVHADADQGYRPLSEAMVNIRATLAAAERATILLPKQARQLSAAAKRLFYPDRTLPALLEAAKRDLAHDWCDRFALWLRDTENRVDQKRLDALELVRAITDLRDRTTERKVVPWVFRHTDAWEQVRRSILPRVAAEALEGSALAGAAAEGARLRALEIELAKRDGFNPSSADIEVAVADYCRLKGLPTVDALCASLEDDGLSWEEFERLMRDEACIRRSRLVMTFDIDSFLADVKQLTPALPEADRRGLPLSSIEHERRRVGG